MFCFCLCIVIFHIFDAFIARLVKIVFGIDHKLIRHVERFGIIDAVLVVSVFQRAHLGAVGIIADNFLDYLVALEWILVRGTGSAASVSERPVHALTHKHVHVVVSVRSQEGLCNRICGVIFDADKLAAGYGRVMLDKVYRLFVFYPFIYCLTHKDFQAASKGDLKPGFGQYAVDERVIGNARDSSPVSFVRSPAVKFLFP